MRLDLAQWLPAPPEAAWPYLTEPALMNAWSLAPVRPVAPGDGGATAGVGAMREVRVRALGREIRLCEVIERAEPPRALVYRVVNTTLVRGHRGELTLRPERGGAQLRWQVDADLAVPGLGAGVGMLLERQLAQSLAALADTVRGAPSRGVEAASPLDDPATDELWARAESVLREQRELADRLEAAGDPKRWFARVYQHVTECQLEGCRDGRVTHVAWVLRIVPRFHDHYMGNLRAWLGEAPGWPESQWRTAFAVMERTGGRYRDPAYRLFRGLLEGVRAHIEEDLPRALAQVWARHYAERCDYARFRADYILMADVFRGASDRLLERVPRSWFPRYVRLLDSALPEALLDAFRNWRFYDVPRQRLRAFERGGRLAAMLLEARREAGQLT